MTSYRHIWLDSPAVLAVKDALAQLPELAGVAEPVDVKDYVDPDLMSDANVEAEFAGHEFPDSDWLGLPFKRKVLKNRYGYFSTRDQIIALDRLAADADFVYTGSDDLLDLNPPRYAPTWPRQAQPDTDPSAHESGWFLAPTGERIGFRLCISPQMGVPFSQRWLDFITGWVKWLFPRFRHSITVAGTVYDGVQVIVCDLTLLDLTFTMLRPMTIYYKTVEA